MFSLNDILEVSPGCKACFEGVVRIVATSEDGEMLALVRLDLPRHAAPFNRSVAELGAALEGESIRRLDTFETGLPASSNELSETKRERLAAITALMSPLMGDDLLILDAAYRGREFIRHASQAHVNVRTVRRHFNAYLWGGMTELALAGPQKAKPTCKGQQRTGTARRGPKPRDPAVASRIPLPEVRSQLEAGARLYYLSGKHTMLEAFVLTLNKYFSRGKRAIKKGNEGIRLEDILRPSGHLPSYAQFRYVCDLLAVESGGRTEKPRQILPPRQKSAKRGKARRGTHGPGYRYEIDATRLQIRIVSRYSRRNLLREATLYIIIDVWSGAIVGYAISLDPASWALAAKALRNCFTDKTEVFKRLKLPYGASDWVARHLPTRLAADRAELVGNKAGIVPEIGIKVEIMPSLRPDRKGTVEGKFEAIKHGDNFYMKPGSHIKNPQRRQRDGKQDAAFTLVELEKLIVEIIIDLNNDPVPIDAIPAEAIKAGRSAITYGGLFEWGLAHRAGFTRTLPSKEVFNNLLLRATARVTAEGIHFRKQNYICDTLFQLGLPQRAARKGAFEIDIRYDEYFGESVWFVDPQLQEWVPAHNDNEDVARLKASFWELEDFLQAAEKLAFDAKTENILKKNHKAKRLNRMAGQAIREARAAKAGQTKSQSKAQIAANTAVEATAERLLQAKAAQASFAAKLNPTQEETVPPQEDSPPRDDPAASPAPSVGQRSLELWRKMNANLGK